MNSNNGFPGCLSIVATLLGILTGVLTIVAYFFPNSGSLLETLGRLLPRTYPFFIGLERGVTQFAESWPLGPWLSALVIFLFIGILRYLVEVVFELLTVELTISGVISQALIFLPLALLWIWIFSSVASGFGILAFIAGYIASITVSIRIAADFG